MSRDTGGGVRKVPKKCQVLFEWPLTQFSHACWPSWHTWVLDLIPSLSVSVDHNDKIRVGLKIFDLNDPTHKKQSPGKLILLLFFFFFIFFLNILKAIFLQNYEWVKTESKCLSTFRLESFCDDISISNQSLLLSRYI